MYPCDKDKRNIQPQLAYEIHEEMLEKVGPGGFALIDKRKSDIGTDPGIVQQCMDDQGCVAYRTATDMRRKVVIPS